MSQHMSPLFSTSSSVQVSPSLGNPRSPPMVSLSQKVMRSAPGRSLSISHMSSGRDSPPRSMSNASGASDEDFGWTHVAAADAFMRTPDGERKGSQAGSPGLFCPEKVQYNETGFLPNLSKEELPPGTTVWIGDIHDVFRLMGCLWEPAAQPVCNCSHPGIVLRHAGDFTVIRFQIDEASFRSQASRVLIDGLSIELDMPSSGRDIILTLTFPRCVLSTEPAIDDAIGRSMLGHFVPSKSFLFKDANSLNPRAGHEKNIGARQPPPAVHPYDVACTFEHATTALYEYVFAAINAGQIEDAMLFAEQSASTPVVKHCCTSLVAMAAGDGERAFCEANTAAKHCPEDLTAKMRLWHACQMIGRTKQARDLLNCARLVLPHHAVLMQMQFIGRDLAAADTQIQRRSLPLTLQTDYYLRRFVTVRRSLHRGEFIGDDTPSLACSLIGNDKICDVCLKPIPRLQRNARHLECRLSQGPDPLYCSMCLPLAQDSHLQAEAQEYQRLFRNVRGLCHHVEGEHQAPVAISLRVVGRFLQATMSLSNSNVVNEDDDAEGVRLFEQICSSASLFPLEDPNLNLYGQNKAEYKLRCVYHVLSSRFSPFHLRILTANRFFSLFLTAQRYARPIHVRTEDGVTQGAVVLPMCGLRDDASIPNAYLQLNANTGTVEAYADQDMEFGTVVNFHWKM